jgi:tRNA (guanine-N7-)-methyltransferase
MTVEEQPTVAVVAASTSSVTHASLTTDPAAAAASTKTMIMTKKRPIEEDLTTTTKATPNSSNNNTTTLPLAMMTPITSEGDMPKKRFYRQRAHCNPLSHNDNFDYPRGGPDCMDWTTPDLYPPVMTKDDDDVEDERKDVVGTAPTVLDIGCGFGGLTVALATILPNDTILGMEIRAKVTEYVRLRLLALRKEHLVTSTATKHTKHLGHRTPYQNASVIRTNSMKFSPNYFHKASIRKIFFCFPDPHFKRKNHPRRIVSTRLLSEYAYFLKPGVGMLYTITDVKELHEWHVSKCNAHPLFERVTDEENDNDPCVRAMITETEEGKKVERNGGNKYFAVYRRIHNPPPSFVFSRRNTKSTATTTVPTTVAETTSTWHLGNFFPNDEYDDGALVVVAADGVDDDD